MLQAIFIGFSMLIFVFAFLLLPTMIITNSRLALLTSQIKKLESEGAISREVDINSIDQKSKELREKLDNKIGLQPDQYIKTVNLLLPKGVKINRFVYDKEKTLDIFGIAETRDVLQLYIKNLRESETISIVESPISNFIKNKNGTFSLSILFK